MYYKRALGLKNIIVIWLLLQSLHLVLVVLQN